MASTPQQAETAQRDILESSQNAVPAMEVRAPCDSPSLPSMRHGSLCLACMTVSVVSDMQTRTCLMADSSPCVM